MKVRVSLTGNSTCLSLFTYCSGRITPPTLIREWHSIPIHHPLTPSRLEPEENLENCARLLRKFWDDVGVDDEDYYEGYVVKARPSWISSYSFSQIAYLGLLLRHVQRRRKRYSKSRVRRRRLQKVMPKMMSQRRLPLDLKAEGRLQ